MKVLWITNILFPEAKAYITGSSVFNTSGGWLLGMSDSLQQYRDLELFTATVSGDVNKLEIIKGERIVHYVFPRDKKHYRYVDNYEKYWRMIVNDCNPDIIHIHGTENVQALPCIRIFPEKKYVVNIQGLMSEIYKYYNYGLSSYQILSNITLRDVFKTDMFREKRKLKKRGDCEIEVLNSVKHVIGRTSWDKAISLSINPQLTYHYGGESLRNEFYSGCWSFSKCIPHSLFLSQAGHPFKGFHQLLKAMPIILREFPDLQVRVAGPDIMKLEGNWITKLKLSGYGKILRTLVNQFHLGNHITFLGFLNAEEIKKELLKSNVFISCSSIDNSPNSLGEAQMLGVPCVASYVGGVPDMVPNDNCGYLYRFEDYQQLAFCIMKQFNNSTTFDNSIMRHTAFDRHNRSVNASSLYEIYSQLYSKKSK